MMTTIRIPKNSDELLKQALATIGVTVLTSETIQTGEMDFSAQLSRISDAVPDAVFISGQPIEIPEILRQIRQHGLSTMFQSSPP